MLVDLERDTLNAPQAARLLGVGSPTIRRDVATGRIVGRHEGREYRIPLGALAHDRRFPAELRELLLGEQDRSTEDNQHPTRRRSPELARAVVPLNVMLRPEDAQVLAVGVERYGTKRATVSAALRQLDETLPHEQELRRLQDELEQNERRLEQARAESTAAKERAAKLPDELYCDGCGAFVPLAQLEPEDSREHGGVVWRHRHEGFDSLRYGSERLLGRRKYG